MSALDERLTQLEQRIFGPAEKDAEYPKVWSCCCNSCFGGQSKLGNGKSKEGYGDTTLSAQLHQCRVGS